jgi:hypothetical protein
MLKESPPWFAGPQQGRRSIAQYYRTIYLIGIIERGLAE